jgi:hypothetical protein
MSKEAQKTFNVRTRVAPPLPCHEFCSARNKLRDVASEGDMSRFMFRTEHDFVARQMNRLEMASG